MTRILSAVVALSVATFAAAQQLNSANPGVMDQPSTFKLACGADLLVDDFSVQRDWTAPGTGEQKRLNALEGDWGIYGGNFTIDPAAKTLTVTPARGATEYPPSDFNPNTVPTYQWFYTQFSNQKEQLDKACVDISPFQAVQLDVLAPAGFDFNITYTQRKKGDCKTRTFDSKYKLFSEYYKTPGVKQTITLAFADFSTDLSGAPFDYSWDKDLTLINLNGANPGDSLVISNVWLKGKPCAGATASSGAAAPTGAATKAASTASATAKAATPTNAAVGKNGGWATLAGVVAVVGAAAAF